MKDWFILLIALMTLGVGLIKSLPWGYLVTGGSVQHGSPHDHFVMVAFVASLIEDV